MSLEEKLFHGFIKFITWLFDWLSKSPIVLAFTFLVTSWFIQSQMTNMFNSVLAETCVIFMWLSVTKIEYGLNYNENTVIESLFKKPRINWLPAYFGGILITLISVIITTLYTGQTFQLSHLSENLPLGAIMSYIFVAPVSEEIIFRQLLYRDGLLSRYHKPVALGLSIIAFALIHTPTHWFLFLRYVLASTTMYYVYEKTEHDIRASIIFHIVYNIIAIL